MPNTEIKTEQSIVGAGMFIDWLLVSHMTHSSW